MMANITDVIHSFLVIFTVLVATCDAIKILFAGCQDSKSHMNSLLPLAKKLASNGYDVTYFMPILDQMPEPGGGVKGAFVKVKTDDHEEMSKQMFSMIWKSEMSAPVISYIFHMSDSGLKLMLEQKPSEFWAIANDNWDLVVVDELFNMFGYGVALHNHRLHGKPFAVFSTTNPLPTLTTVNSLGRSPVTRPSFYISSEPLAWNVTNFFDRFATFKSILLEHFTVGFLNVQFSTTSLRAMGVSAFSWHDYYSKTSINFIDYPDRYLYPEPIGSNMIYTGSICSDAKPLSPDLLQFVNDPNSKGTIYVALGSYVHWDYAPKHILKAFVDAVNELSEYRIIWGFHGTQPTNIGKHVKIFDWTPQNDILHHEKTVLFISHGGLKSVKESICSETPVLFLSIFAEQSMNALTAKELGFAETMSKFSVTKEEIVTKCKKVINNDNYLKVVKKTRAMFVDRILHPLDDGLFWAKKMIRYNGNRVNFMRKGLNRRWHEHLFIDSLGIALLFFGLIASK